MLARWKPGRLLGATVAWWGALGLATLGDAAAAVWRAAHLPAGGGGVSLSAGDGLLTLTASESGRPFFTGSIAPGTLFLWVAGPPLLLLLAWLWARGRERRADARALAATGVRDGRYPPEALGSGGPIEAELLRRREAERAPTRRDTP